MANEFDLIHRYFSPLAGPEGLGLEDDAACVTVEPECDLVVTKDMLVEGVHFFGNDPASSIAHKSLAANLSDLAAKGAKPKHYFLGLSLPGTIDDAWLQVFSDALAKLQRRTGIRLAGGDTTRSLSGVVVSITAMGTVPHGKMVRRSGAQVDDLLFVTGTLGDAALGLKCLEGHIEPTDSLIERYRYPEARSELGITLAPHIHACADVSDGLLADLGHIAKASGVGADVALRDIPLSPMVRQLITQNPEYEDSIYAGGDDYELVFTAAASKRAKLEEICADAGVRLAVVGRITENTGIRLIDQNGKLVHTERTGFQHFET
ncbi:thiamine-phosphate kinase [Kordiimonas sp.]|uniref:thiamine-phosphate kinase n=1 Tax=Kordiimonas sp. TaxID=1970157 RepID=UPI003A90462D